jgi:hypothetical protein
VFRARILVKHETDVAAELAKIENLATRHGLDDVTTFAMLRNVEAVLTDLKRQDSETAAYGISIAVKKTVASEDYDILLELQPRKEPSRKKGPLSRLFGR